MVIIWNGDEKDESHARWTITYYIPAHPQNLENKIHNKHFTQTETNIKLILEKTQIGLAKVAKQMKCWTCEK